MFKQQEIVIVERMPCWNTDGQHEVATGALVALTSFEDGLQSRRVHALHTVYKGATVDISTVQMDWFFYSAELGTVRVSLSPMKDQQEVQRVSKWFRDMITSRISTPKTDV